MRYLLVALSCCLFSCLATSQTISPEKKAQYEKEYKEIVTMFRTETGYEEIDRADVLQFIDKKNSRSFLVTKPGHPAHPAVVTRQLVEVEGHFFVKMDGIGRGDQVALKTWIDYMNSEDKRVVQQKREEGAK